MCVSKAEFKALQVRVDEIYEWMTLTQTDRMEKLTNKIIEMQEMLFKLQKEV